MQVISSRSSHASVRETTEAKGRQERVGGKRTERRVGYLD